MSPDLRGFLSSFDNDEDSTPQWMLAIQHGVEQWNLIHGTDLDPHETWLKYASSKRKCHQVDICRDVRSPSPV